MIEDLIRIRGIGPSMASRLVKAGISTIEQLGQSRPEELAFVKGIGVPTAKKMIKQAQGLLQFEKGLSIVLDHIKQNFIQSCPKCGGEMQKKYLIINQATRMHVRQCLLCKFYLPA